MEVDRGIQALCLLEFETSAPLRIALMALYLVGLWRLLVKSGLKGWWALIPGARDYQLARCAEREPEGRVYSLTGAGSIALNLILLFLLSPVEETRISGGSTLVIVLELSLLIVRFIYGIRVWSGMIEVYGVRKRWMWLCLFSFTRWLLALIWGFHKQYQPEWQVEDIKAEMARLASSGSATVMDEGLTVNLKERSTMEFFQKKVLLRDIHMSIPQGHMVLLLGGSGAGKTTYLNAINGYEKADAEVMLNGTNMYKQYRKM